MARHYAECGKRADLCVLGVNVVSAIAVDMSAGMWQALGLEMDRPCRQHQDLQQNTAGFVKAQLWPAAQSSASMIHCRFAQLGLEPQSVLKRAVACLDGLNAGTFTKTRFQFSDSVILAAGHVHPASPGK